MADKKVIVKSYEYKKMKEKADKFDEIVAIIKESNISPKDLQTDSKLGYILLKTIINKIGGIL